ncbi:MAG: asparagine synthase (glutamine-hydrolyzing) [Ignavibacteriota bacterium]|nr:asparagine synthase (glutamine-hydrolyzing) [Ignavibacteriota bacterium]MCC7095498.1 asparagine synthase (glutamine-hydrolyzing) [Ignavibacteriaceae bacterium]MEB2297734.1 asparagine synthase (glutamine-hydrolyzing) [Ignavibacteria bacterium]NUM61512.1 asparagine synthase (glutamine-hydrolyzing) [Ignavibacteriaceae bacterium]QKJ95408.1 MAG: asparagine synthase (glutamine-hydrolyzing) [Ignavibacteriota bacterium]
MCGICGQFYYKENHPVSIQKLKRMTDSITHRGPDDEGYHISDSIGLGFRRLSIIDLSGGHQPMSDQEKNVWVIFNGEIYNFPELKKELEGYGHIFQTRSDTEVIVHGYKQWGIDVLNHLNGMFGLAIWDEKKKRLVLARDRMGIKMIYYKIENGLLYFGSEIRAILAGLNQKPDINSSAINLFLRYRYTPAPHTIYNGIQKLAAGTCLIVENGNAEVKRWWNYKPQLFDPVPSEAQVKEELLELYRQAVKSHLLSDVPLGILLSGGVDSSMLLALMNEFGEGWKSFTVGYGKSFADDELDDAKETAEIFKSSHYSVEINRQSFEQTLSKIIACVEEPIASSSIVPMYHVCQKARQEVKVALMGQGPDELFGGYTRHLGVQYGKYWRSIPEIMRKPVGKMLTILPRNESIRRGLYSLEVPQRMIRYQQIFSVMSQSIISDLFQEKVLPDGFGNRIPDSWKELEKLLESTDELGGFQYLEIRSSLPDELLMYGDKLSMAHSLEVRVPYLDTKIVEYVERLPAKFKIRFGNRKWIHKQVCSSYLPKQIINRKKRGFAVNVVDRWFKESLSNEFDGMLLDKSSRMYEFLKPEEVQYLYKDHINGKSDNHKILFSLIVLEKWMRDNNF